jgi:hypothetical protein
MVPFADDRLDRAAEGPCWDEGIEVLSATPNWIRLAASYDLRTAERLVQFINEIADLPDTKKDVATGFREILLNAIERGAHFNPNEFVEISYLRARHMVICCVQDPGESLSRDRNRHILWAALFLRQMLFPCMQTATVVESSNRFTSQVGRRLVVQLLRSVMRRNGSRRTASHPL